MTNRDKPPPWLLFLATTILSLAMAASRESPPDAATNDQETKPAAFDGNHTGFRSCEMCTDRDGLGQCVFITEGKNEGKQAMCLPSWAREEGCGDKASGTAICGSVFDCTEQPIEKGKGAKKFRCGLEGEHIKAGF